MHVRTHSWEKPYECQQCQKALIVLSSLYRHVGTHSRENLMNVSNVAKLSGFTTPLQNMQEHTAERECMIVGSVEKLYVVRLCLKYA